MIAIGGMVSGLVNGGLLPAAIAQFGAPVPAPAKPSGIAHAPPTAKRIDGTIDARSMNLLCDGKTDNAPVFDAIHRKASATTGQTVLFPAASHPCLTSRPLIADSGTTYRANPDTMTLQPTSGSSANPLLFMATGVSNVLVQGLGFDGALDSAINGNNVAVVQQSDRVVFDNVTVRNTRGIGIVFSTGVTESGVRDSHIANVGSHWKVTGLKSDQRQGVAFCCGTNNNRNFVAGSTFDDTGLDAISFSRQTNFLASGNRAINVGGAIAGVMGRGLKAGVANHGLAGGAAIYGAESAGVTVVGNTTDGAGGNGIDLYKVNGAEIAGNTARRSGGNGIAFAAGSNATITNNLVLDNNQARSTHISAPQAGMFLTGGLHGDPPVHDVRFSGNFIADNQTNKTQNYGIQLQDGSAAGNIVIDRTNHIQGNAIAVFGEGLAGYRLAGTPKYQP